MADKVAEQATHRQRLRLEMARRRQQPDKQQAGQQPQRRNAAQRQRPAAQVTQHTGQQAAKQATQRGTAHIKPHRHRQRSRLELFTDIGHGQRRQTAQRNAQQGPQHQQQLPVAYQRRGQPKTAGHQQCRHHHRLAPPAFA